MVGDASQRVSWWKFKSRGLKDNDEEGGSLGLKSYEGEYDMSDHSQLDSNVITNGASGGEGSDGDEKLKNIIDLRNQYKLQKQSELYNNEIFGAPLEQALEVSNICITITSKTEDYGKVPTVVATCGSYLKQNGLCVEGIFRVGGSTKRVKELQEVFSSPPNYGRYINWDGYNVHDAASILRRYLNCMPEPVIPLELYETFREPLKKKSAQYFLHYLYGRQSSNSKKEDHSEDQETIVPSKTAPRLVPPEELNDPKSLEKKFVAHEHKKPVLPRRPVSKGESKENDTIETKEVDKEVRRKRRYNYYRHKNLTKSSNAIIGEYEVLVSQLPPSRRQLLLYLLDLLSVFSQRKDDNKMTTANLAAVFQPSILSHPKHDMEPVEYAFSQKIVEILVEYSYVLFSLATPAKSEKRSEERKKKRDSSSAKRSSRLPSAEAPLLPAKLDNAGIIPNPTLQTESSNLLSAQTLPQGLTNGNE